MDLEHCRKNHTYKFKNNIEIKYKIVESKKGDGKWEKVEYVSNAGPTTMSSTKIQDDFPRQVRLKCSITLF